MRRTPWMIGYELGWQAHQRGVKSAPALDRSIKPIIHKLRGQPKAIIALLDGWNKGWHTRNLKAVNNPSKNRCEYCLLLHHKRRFATTKEMRRLVAHRWKMHRIAMHKNPDPRSELLKFVKYVWHFYGPGQIYGKFFGNRLSKREVILAARKRMLSKRWGDGDSVDREAVRDYLMSLPKYRAIRNPLSSKTKRRALKLATKLSYRIWKHVNQRGFALPIPKRTPKIVKKYAQAILKANKINVRLKNPPDRSAARELQLYVENDSALYEQQKSIIRNLMRKLRKGVFRKHLAAKLFLYLVDNGARKYVKEFGGPHDTVKMMFPLRTRLRVARVMARYFLTEARLGNYDRMM